MRVWIVLAVNLVFLPGKLAGDRQERREVSGKAALSNYDVVLGQVHSCYVATIGEYDLGAVRDEAMGPCGVGEQDGVAPVESRVKGER